uniref:hypothetical protein n=1 Tax=Acidocella sp. C78 TaxID=1671486 RepID=UPI0020BF03D7|nr:hypothetical protein [Acidocella sp. C78]
MASTGPSWVIDPGATVTVSEAGTVGVQASPSATMPPPSIAALSAPIATITLRLRFRMSVSSGIAPG